MVGGQVESATLLPGSRCSATPWLVAHPSLTRRWWRSLERDLAATDGVEPPVRVLDPLAVCRRISVFFGLDVDTDVRRWRMSRGGLCWSDLRGEPPAAEGGTVIRRAAAGLAPRGYDAASLLCHALAVPEVAEQVAHRFRGVLDTDDGVVSQLHVLSVLLTRADAGEHPTLVAPIHRHVDRLIGRPTLLRPTTA